MSIEKYKGHLEPPYLLDLSQILRNKPTSQNQISMRDLLIQAIQNFQSGNIEEAQRKLKYVLRFHPKTFEALHLMGIISGLQGSPMEAQTYFKKALKLEPNNSSLNFNIAKALSDSGNDVQALDFHKKATTLDPNNFQAWINFGITLDKLKKHEGAMRAYETAININPKSVLAWLNRGITLESIENHEQALDSLNKAADLDPKCAEVWSNRGNALLKLGRLDEALASYDKAIDLKPDYAEAWSNRGNALAELNQYENAVDSYEKSIQIRPDYAEAWFNLGNALPEEHEYKTALDSYDKSLAINPQYAEAWFNRGNILAKLGQYESALESYDKAVAIKPNYPDVFWNKAHVQLVTGDFKSGWMNYEFRWHRKEANPKFHQNIRALDSVDNIASKRILVWWEQGYGDTIQFSRYILMLEKLGAQVIFDCQAPLKELLQRSFPSSKIVERDKDVIENIDFQVPLMSLPGLFATDPSHVPYPGKYLEPSAENTKAWRTRLHLDETKLKIGLSCSGAKSHKNDKNRSADLKYFEPLLGLGNVFLIQKDLKNEDEKFLGLHPEINFLGPQISSFDDSASILELMDITVTVDTSLVHLSGAINKPTMLLLPWYPEWRWLLGRQDSPWYSSLRLFRQPRPGDWTSVIRHVVTALQA